MPYLTRLQSIFLVLCLLAAGLVTAQRVTLAPGESIEGAIGRLTSLPGSEPELRVESLVDVAETLRIPAGVKVVVTESGSFRIADRADLVIDGALQAPVQQIFIGEGHVRLGRKFALAEWFGARGDGAYDPVTLEILGDDFTPSYHAYRKAATAVGDSGRVHFGPGVFIMADAEAGLRRRFGRGKTADRNTAAITFFTAFDDGSADTYDYLEVTGEGMGVTHWVSPEETVAGVSYAPYRSRGWLDTAADLDRQAAFAERVPAGATEVPLRTPELASRFAPGDGIFMRQGASVWDQDKGQFNVVAQVKGRVLVLAYPLRTAFGPEDGSAAGTVGEFTQPGEGETTTVIYQPARGTSRKPLGGADGTATINGDLYEVVRKVDEYSYTVRNVPGQGNRPAGTPIPEGTTAMKARVIFPVRTSTRGASLASGTCVGGRDAWQLSNYLDCSARDVEMLHRGSRRGGLTINGDGGLNFTMYNCTTRVRAGEFEGSQIARSTTNFRSYDSEWINVKHSIVEFSAGTEFHGDTFVFDSHANRKVDEPDKKKGKAKSEANNVAAMLVGPTTGYTRFDGCRFVVTGDRRDKAIGTSDVMHYGAVAGGATEFRNTDIEVDGVGIVFSNKNAGLRLESVHVSGRARTLFGDLGLDFKEHDRLTAPGRPAVDEGVVAVLDDFQFRGEVDQIFGGQLYAVEVKPNSAVVRTGSAEGTALVNADRLVNGTLVTKNGPSTYPVYRVRVDLSVTGWPRVPGSDAIKFGGRLNAGDFIRFRHTDLRDYREEAGKGYRLNMVVDEAVEEVVGK